ncbi:MAG: carotenoid 1,2-hydratase [Gammaproteobacteria bacterium]|nr:carotenoid 1,2-hydratase [Gammaproteobacteria bacterium]
MSSYGYQPTLARPEGRVGSCCATACLLALLVLALAAAGCTEPVAEGGRLSTVLGGEELDGFRRATMPASIEFPRDHGAHPDFRSEWWYFTAVLHDARGRDFGVQFTLFRQALLPHSGRGPWRTAQVYMGHLAVSDVEAGIHHQAERLVRGHPRLAGVSHVPNVPAAPAPASKASFAAWIEGWRLASVSTAFLPMTLIAEDAKIGLDLHLEQTKPIVLQGDAGFSAKGPANASYYYSVPRLAVSGTVRVAGDSHEVTGRGWLDREWSTSVLAREYAGWDWFALQLDDGRDFMLYQLRRRDGAQDAYNGATAIDPGGDAKRLDPADVRLTATHSWRGWPVRWELSVGDERFAIVAAFDDQVMETFVRYWEGLVWVESESGERLGSGYMELTGY